MLIGVGTMKYNCVKQAYNNTSAFAIQWVLVGMWRGRARTANFDELGRFGAFNVLSA